MKRIVCTMMLGLLAMFAPHAEAANVYYVATNATDTYNGSSWSKAFTNVQTALDAAASNDTICLAGQTFEISTQLVWTTSWVTVRGGYAATNAADQPGPCDPARWPTVIARALAVTNRILTINGVTNGLLEYVTVSGGNTYPGAGVYVTNKANVVLSGCSITSNSFSVVLTGRADGGGLYAVSNCTVTLSNCLVKGNTAKNTGTSGASHANGGGIWSEGVLMLRDSRILDNTASCGTPANGKGGGIYFNGTNLTLQNVLMANNGSSGSGQGVYVGRGIAALANCTLADHRGEALYGAGGTVVLTNGIVYGTWSDSQIGGTVTVSYSLVGLSGYTGDHNIGGDPRFEYGYYLGAGSPCTNAGSATATSLGLAGYAKNAAGATYGATETVNLGYHYATGMDLTYADLYVAPAPAGNDGNSGTNAAQPLATVTKALSLARDGTRVHVGAGTYTNGAESFPLRIAGKTDVQILGTNAALTILNARGSGTRVMDLSLAHRTLLSLLTLTGGTNYPGAGISINGSQDVRLSGCTVSSNLFVMNSYSVPSYGAGIYAVSNSSVTLSNCLVKGNTARNNGTSSSSHANGGGIWSDGKLALRDAVVADNTAYCALTANGRGAGVYFAGTNLVVMNVLMATNNGTGQGDGIYISAGTVMLTNATVANNGGEGVSLLAGRATIGNSILWGNGTDATGMMTVAYSDVGVVTTNVATTNCISTDPLFVDTTYYHLKSSGGNYVGGYFDGGAWATSLSNSPCLDAGDPASDYSREPDPNGLRVNMGCYGNTPVASKSPGSSTGSVIIIW